MSPARIWTRRGAGRAPVATGARRWDGVGSPREPLGLRPGGAGGGRQRSAPGPRFASPSPVYGGRRDANAVVARFEAPSRISSARRIAGRIALVLRPMSRTSPVRRPRSRRSGLRRRQSVERFRRPGTLRRAGGRDASRPDRPVPAGRGGRSPDPNRSLIAEPVVLAPPPLAQSPGVPTWNVMLREDLDIAWESG